MKLVFSTRRLSGSTRPFLMRTVARFEEAGAHKRFCQEMVGS